MATVLMIIAPEQFSEKELFTIKNDLEEAGHRTIIASIAAGLCSGSRQSTITATHSLSDVHTEDYDAVVFVGGRGSEIYFASEVALRIAAEMAAAGKITAAICLAPAILAYAGVLENRRATVAKIQVRTLESKKVKYTGPGVTVDGHIITGSSPEYSRRFVQEIIKRLGEYN